MPRRAGSGRSEATSPSRPRKGHCELGPLDLAHARRLGDVRHAGPCREEPGDDRGERRDRCRCRAPPGPCRSRGPDWVPRTPDPAPGSARHAWFQSTRRAEPSATRQRLSLRRSRWQIASPARAAPRAARRKCGQHLGQPLAGAQSGIGQDRRFVGDLVPARRESRAMQPLDSRHAVRDARVGAAADPAQRAPPRPTPASHGGGQCAPERSSITRTGSSVGVASRAPTKSAGMARRPHGRSRSPAESRRRCAGRAAP